MKKLFDVYQSAFSMDAVRIDFDEFAKDGAFSDESIRNILIEGGHDAIYIKPLSSAERVELEIAVAGLHGKKNMHNVYAKWVTPSWVDSDGEPAGTEKEIGSLRSDLIYELFLKVTEMNAIGKGDAEKAGKD